MSDTYSKMFQQMMENSQELLSAFASASAAKNSSEKVAASVFEGAFPMMSAEMMEAWFGKAFNCEGLGAKTRLLVTLAGLIVSGVQVEPQMKLVIRHALQAGATQREILEVVWQMSAIGGLPVVQSAFTVAQDVFAEFEEKRE